MTLEGLRELVESSSGIHLSSAKRALLSGRLARRVRELGLAGFGEYHELARRDAAERVRLVDLVATNETRFFREPRHFELLEQRVLPRIAADAAAGRRPPRLRAWSAACATGEEPYSLAMVALRALPGFDVEILASDISTRALDQARAAVYRVTRASDIPSRHLKAHMRRGVRSQEGLMMAGPQLRAAVRFERRDLVSEPCPAGPFDLVFCRNVLIYFRPETRTRVVDKLVDALAGGGLLFLGHAESLLGASRGLRPVIPTVYARPEEPPGRAARP
jgi:chemotaxis protein methyltransferase CheR